MPSIYIPGTTPHCWVSTEGNVNFLGTRNLVYSSPHPASHPASQEDSRASASGETRPYGNHPTDRDLHTHTEDYENACLHHIIGDKAVKAGSSLVLRLCKTG